MKSGDENVLAKCKFFRKMQVTSCKICGRSDGRCRWKKRWFYAVPNVVVGMYSTLIPQHYYKIFFLST